MKRTLLSLLSTITILSAAAQTQVPNGNFEQWENVGSNTEEPNEWNGIKTGEGGLIGLAPKTLQRSTAIRPGATGQYCARLYTGSALGYSIPGIMTTGRVNIVSTSEAYVYSNTGNAAFNAQLTAWPDSLVFWSRYVSGTGTDHALMRAVIHDSYNYQDPPNAASSSHVVAELIFEIPHSGTQWVRHAIPFDYTGPAGTPAYILISCGSNTGEGNAADQLFLDDLELKYNPLTTTATNVNPLAYNVSATQGAAISVPFTKTGIFHFGNVFTAQLSDAGGSFASPVTLGTLTSNTAGTINGTIPAGTAPGNGYRVRVIASTPYQAANDNGSNISISEASNAISPSATQTIAANTNGTPLTVTEGSAPTSRVWKFALTAGGASTPITPPQNGITYTPHFANEGIYFVSCESNFGGATVTSNEVQINVVKNHIAPAGTQSMLSGVAGTTLTVTESPAGTQREWKFATAPGGPYQSFGTAETGTSYTPLFNTTGLYHIVCQSQINGVWATSNEVIFSVGNLTISTGGVAGSPFEFSASAPAAVVDVPFTVNQPFNPGNVFTAELSDANGSFNSPTVIGTLAGQNGGTIQTSLPSNLPAGGGYLVRVTGNNPIVLGTDNGTGLTVDQYHTGISPSLAQSIPLGMPANTLTVTESQNSVSRGWRVSSVSGGPYSNVVPAENGSTYTPVFNTPGTYYVVCASTNVHGDEVLSNEVSITVNNGTQLGTGNIGGSPFYVSPGAQNNISIPVNTNVQFDAGNVFTVELSSPQGTFNMNTVIGTQAGASPVGLTALLPNNAITGSGYRIRVNSSSPAITGTDNGGDLSIIGYEAHAAPLDSQHIYTYMPVAPISFTCTHPFMQVQWKYKTTILGSYEPFNPPVTGYVFGPHVFTETGMYMLVAEGTNMWGDVIQTEQIVVNVTESPAGITENESGTQIFVYDGRLTLNLAGSQLGQSVLRLVNMAGQTVFEKQLQPKSDNQIQIPLSGGIYLYTLSDGIRTVTGKLVIP